MIQMQIFYAPDITGETFALDENESKHLIRVLRMTKGTIVRLIDGKGSLYEGVISSPDARRCIIDIRSRIEDFEKRDYRLHIAISPLKNPDRFEWFIEKSVEIGIDEITPILCKNTEKTGIKVSRIENLIISAMKQSLKATKTVFNNPVSFNDFIKSVNDDIKLIAHCNSTIHRISVAEAYTKGKNATILIGPEGDFTGDEIAKGVDNGFNSVHLGSSRLRTETAGIAACHSVYFINQ
jgi:16S rRNA (uracil1498-N3)-methyltransferase